MVFQTNRCGKRQFAMSAEQDPVRQCLSAVQCSSYPHTPRIKKLEDISFAEMLFVNSGSMGAPKAGKLLVLSHHASPPQVEQPELEPVTPETGSNDPGAPSYTEPRRERTLFPPG
ncbi:hypothetical protein BaRGS_00018376 [Batillaria attramentaria]|uniref:Uncharacterized protein n=1 Tax=Batillaria attramentaria TaxID=370345 RepID=A0ABD0KT64_9CAEN